MSEGTVYQCRDGRWCAKYKDASDNWKYVHRRTKAEAKKALREALKDRDDGIISADKQTMGMLLDEWLEDMRQDVSNALT
jgi:hypothetical protein